MTRHAHNDCVEVRRRGSLFVDGRLREESSRRVRQHLSECEDCARELELLRRVSEATAGLPVSVPRIDLADRVRARVAERRRGQGHSLVGTRRRLVGAVAAATVAVATVAGWVGYAFGRAANTRTPLVVGEAQPTVSEPESVPPLLRRRPPRPIGSSVPIIVDERSNTAEQPIDPNARLATEPGEPPRSSEQSPQGMRIQATDLMREMLREMGVFDRD